jgi:hypothetical protein
VGGSRVEDSRKDFIPQAANFSEQLVQHSKRLAFQRRQQQMLLKRLHVRGLIAKVPGTRRWQVTTHRQQVLGSCVRVGYHGSSTAA